MLMDESVLRKTIGKNIALYRKANKDTQASLGEKLSYTDKAVSKWERGESIPDVYVLSCIAELYGITVSDEIEGLMFAGRCASMDAVAMSSARVMPICMAMGEGAGVGAALAVKQNISPRDVDVRQIREILLASNVLLKPEE